MRTPEETPDFKDLAVKLKLIIDTEPGNILFILERNLAGMFFEGKNASQFYSEEQVRGAIRLARMRSAFGEMGHYIHSHSEEKIIEMVKSSEQPKESTTFSPRTTQ